MLTDPKLKSQVDSLWDKFWSGGLTNPLDAIEQYEEVLRLEPGRTYVHPILERLRAGPGR